MTDDIFKQDDKPDMFDEFKESKPSNGNSRSPKPENYWDKQDIQPAEINVDKFKRKGKSFVIYAWPENDMTEDAYKKLLAVAKVAMENGYTFRHTGNADNLLHEEIRKLDNAKVVSYLPWKKFNSNVSNPILVNPMGYRIAIGIHKAFMRLPSAVRAILGRDVNALLGENIDDPVDMVLAWTDGGAEALTKDTDFKKLGNNSFILQVCRRANIPVLNVYNDTFIERFKSLVSTSTDNK